MQLVGPEADRGRFQSGYVWVEVSSEGTLVVNISKPFGDQWAGKR